MSGSRAVFSRVSGYGKADHLVLIDCANERFETLPLPSNVHFWIFNSNEKHSLVESFYAERFKECQEAFTVLRKHLPGAPNLASISPESFASFRRFLPEPLGRRAAHVVEENARVRRCRELLESGGAMAEVGALLNASHRSSSTLFENSTPALDLLVKLARERPGVYGARLTGGGFGGAILALTDEQFQESHAETVIAAYQAERPDAPRPSVFHVRAGDGAHLSHAVGGQAGRRGGSEG